MIRIPGMLMVGAKCKDDGKTTFACSLLERFSENTDVVGVKVSTVDSVNKDHHPDITGTGLLSRPYCITEEKNRSSKTDTARMARAGAKRVLWLQVYDAHLEEGMSELANTLGERAVSICESNRASRVVEPGAFVMIRGKQDAVWKRSAREAIGSADRIIDFDGTTFNIDLDDIKLQRGRWTVKLPATTIVLAGGKSTRMGRDKAMMPVCGRPMIEHIYRQLSPYFSRMIISANESSRYSFLGSRIIPDEVLDRGPLAGIVSALRASTDDLNFVIACDIPEIDTGLLRAILRQSRNYDAVVPRIAPEKLEPVFAVYRKSALGTLDRALQSGIRRMTDALKLCNVKYVDVSDRRLKNVNTTGEYRTCIEKFADGACHGARRYAGAVY